MRGLLSTIAIGVAHAPETPTIDSLTPAIEKALRPGIAARARSIAKAVRRDGARVAAERLMTGRR